MNREFSLLPTLAIACLFLSGGGCATASKSNADASNDSTMCTDIYSVRDLVFAPAAVAGRAAQDPFLELADLIENVKRATDMAYWQTEGTAIRAEESGTIEVTAKPAMQGRVRQMLADMRRLAAKRS